MADHSMRVLDLWLKRDLMLSLLPGGQTTERAVGKSLAHCMRGDKGTAFNLSRVMRGSALAEVHTDLYYIAATFEYLLLNGAEALRGRATIDDFLDARGRPIPVLLGPLLGTYSDFAVAALALLQQRVDWSTAKEAAARATLGRVVRQALRDEMDAATEDAGLLRMLWGTQRNWAMSPNTLERIVRQPEQDIPPIPAGNFVQIVAPPAATDQWLFGFEVRMDDRAAVMPWTQTGSWFAPRFQRAGEPVALLNEYVRDEDNATATEPGRYWLQIVGLPVPQGLNETPHLPVELTQLLRPVPEWPVGYAEVMATVAYVGQREKMRRQRLGQRAREEAYLEPLAGHEVAVPEQPRLYHAIYDVVASV